VGKKIKVVFDTNVWISIFLKKVLSEEFAQINDQISLYVSKDIILEISKVLMYPKISEILKESRIHEKEILQAISKNSTLVNPNIKLKVIEEDTEDNKILECALTAKADVIVTGDKHLLKLGKFRKTRIVTPREFLDYFS
jgi:putative PIN family toxin of toxin-antitoxin system